MEWGVSYITLASVKCGWDKGNRNGAETDLYLDNVGKGDYFIVI